LIRYKKDRNKIHNRKHEIRDYIRAIIIVLKGNTYWTSYDGNINAGTLYNKYLEFTKEGIFSEFIQFVREKYFCLESTSKLKFQAIDSSFIANKCCSKLERNKHYYNKKGAKVHTIVDALGIPLSILITNGNKSDVSVVEELLKSIKIDTRTKQYKKINKHKQYFLGDKGYDSQAVRKCVEAKGYTVIIDYNKRNTKDPKKVKRLDKKSFKLYKKRIKVEHFFAQLKQFGKLSNVTVKKLDNLLPMVDIISAFIIFRKKSKEIMKEMKKHKW
jgi:transposase